METKKIKAILSAIENQSLSRAAEKLSYTPSALSHMADSLEEELGTRLISRTPAGVTLTEEGKLLYEKLTAVLDAEKELFIAAERLSRERECVLRIGTYSSISMNILPKILRLFKKQYPEIIVSIAVRDNLSGWLESGNADVILADDVAFGENESVTIINDPFVAIVPKNEFAGRNTVSREELYAYSYISTNQSSLRKYFDEDCFSEIVHFDSTDDMSVISMVKEGIGIAVLPKLVINKERKGIRVMKLVPEISRKLGFAYKKDAPHTAATKKFIIFLKNNACLLEGII